MRTFVYKVLALVLLSYAAASCGKKGDPAPDEHNYYFRFKADGVPQDYPYAPFTQLATYQYNESTGYQLIILGRKTATSATANSWAITLGTQGELQTGFTYTHDTPLQVSAVQLLQYRNEDGELYGASRNYGTISITINELTDTYVSGRFSGNLEKHDTSGSTVVVDDTIEITEGAFRVPRQ
jgi:hypothetical protein